MPRGGHRPAELQPMPQKYEKYFDGNRTVRTEKMPSRRWQVREMQDIHHEIARRLLLGQKAPFIASQVGCSAATVRNVKDSPVVQEKLEIMRGARDKDVINVAAHIQRIAPKSIQLLEEVIAGTGAGADANIALRCKVAESNLDRAGYGAVKKFQGAVGHFTSDDIAELKAEAMKRISPVQASEASRTSTPI